MADSTTQPAPHPAHKAATGATSHPGRVDPSLYLHPQTLSRLGSFELRAKMIIEGVMSGQHRSPYAGVSVEFAQHRGYTPGDDLRHLDWKVFARTDRLQIKQYQQETNLDLVVLVDSSGSMNFGTRSFASASGEGVKEHPSGRTNWTKFDHATGFAAALAYVTISQGDRVGMGTFAGELLAEVNRSSGRGTWRKIVEMLSRHPVDTPTNFGRVTDQVIGKLNNRCLLVILSDFFEDADTIRAAMARLRHRGHDVIAFQILDAAERDLTFDEAAPFIGLEGEPQVKVDPRAIRETYVELMAKHIDAVGKTCRSFGFDHEVISTSDWLGPPLASFIARRNAAMKRSKFG
ncbi:MAG: DUF58 domain-containing protein [Planctomycetota bacterium]